MRLHSPVHVERLQGGAPLLEPRDNWWETGVTFNAGAVYLAPTEADAHVVRALLPGYAKNDRRVRDGVVVLLYRARPERDSYRLTRSYLGLAVFTPDFELLRRPEEPVLLPDDDPTAVDHYGIEDPRITRLGEWFYAVYCGPRNRADGGIHPDVCYARSRDLVQWEKLGRMDRDLLPGESSNKDAALFAESFEGRYYLLHRPVIDRPDGSFTKCMHLAVGDSPTGHWDELGPVMRAFLNPMVVSSHLGAGAVPIPLGNGRHLVLYHVGEVLKPGGRHRLEYTLGAALFDLNRLADRAPESLVTHRLERLMVPETHWELEGPSRETVANVLFTCGAYERNGELFIVYGGADTYTLGAKVDCAELLAHLNTCDTTNPYLHQCRP